MISVRVIMRTIEDVLNRLRAEYLEMPGLLNGTYERSASDPRGYPREHRTHAANHAHLEGV